MDNLCFSGSIISPLCLYYYKLTLLNLGHHGSIRDRPSVWHSSHLAAVGTGGPTCPM